MSVTVSKRQWIGTKWVGSDGTIMGGVDGIYVIAATINDAMTQLSMTISCESLSITSSQGDGSRYNCYFLTALVDPRATAPFLDRFGPAGSGTSTNWSDIQSDIAWSSFRKSWADIAQNCVCAVGVAENPSMGNYHSGISAGNSATITKAISASDFDADGNYRGTPLLVFSDRFWNSGNPPFTGYDVDGEAIGVDDYMIRTSVYSLTFDDFRYFPGDIKKGSQWMSHNRYYADNNQGHASILKSGSWRDILNTINPRAAAVNEGWIRSNGQWRSQALIGIDKDTR